jgi:hypothetical protein
MLSLQLQAIPPNACTIQRFLARPTAWVGLVSCKQELACGFSIQWVNCPKGGGFNRRRALLLCRDRIL